MSVYKVPQDVEADDKLLGPFNFRQFIYLIIVAGCIALEIFLWGIFPGLIILPLPIIIFFGALALPLRKDQPMETYLAAVVSFYLKPNKRFWQPDGVEHLIQISAPVNREEHLTKELSQNEASRRLSYLADIVDTEGWAIKHSIAPINTTVREEYSNEARAAEDMFDNSRVSSNVDNLLNQHDQRRKQQIMQNLNMARNLAQFTNENSENIQDKTYYFDPKNRYEGSDNIKFEDVQVSEPAEAKPTAFSQNQQNQYQMNFNHNQPQIQNGAFSNWQNWNQSQVQNYNNFQQNKNWQNQPQQNFDENIHLNYNPYPDSMNQTVISPNWQNQPQKFTQPSPQPLSNFTPPAPQPAQQSEPQSHFENPPDDFNQDLEGINNSFERIRQINETVEREKRDPKVRISTNPENNPFLNRRNFTERESVNKISAEMKRLVSEGKDLSVETLARQANKLADKEKKTQENSNEVDLGEKEVVISLR
jgi:hypothetical protein cdiviTM7_00587